MLKPALTPRANTQGLTLLLIHLQTTNAGVCIQVRKLTEADCTLLLAKK